MRITLADGASLPPIPEEIAAYKNIFIVRTGKNNDGETRYRICGTNSTPETIELNGITATHGVEDTYRSGVAYSSYSEWTIYSEDSGGFSDFLNSVVWANYDVLNLDGSVFLANCVPVTTINPSALMQGFVMQKAAKQSKINKH